MGEESGDLRLAWLFMAEPEPKPLIDMGFMDIFQKGKPSS
jgi:hypothetical protein